MPKSLLKTGLQQLAGLAKSSQILLQMRCSEPKPTLRSRSQSAPRFPAGALLAILLCRLGVFCFVKARGPEAVLLPEGSGSFLSSKTSSWYLWIGNKSQKKQKTLKTTPTLLVLETSSLLKPRSDLTPSEPCTR